MPSGVIQYQTTNFPNKADRENGYVFSSYFSLTSGSSSLPLGATINSVTLTCSINAYVATTIKFRSGSSGNFGDYGTITIEKDTSGTYTFDMGESAKTAFMNFTGGTLSGKMESVKSYSGNVGNIRSTIATLTISYSYSADSKVSLDKLSVAQGGTITATITSSSPELTNIIFFKDSAGTSYSEDIGSSTTYSFEVPTTWALGTATCTINTYRYGNIVDAATTTFTITINPESVQPTISALSVAVTDDSAIQALEWPNVHVKGLCTALVTVTADPGSVGTFENVEITCGSQTQSTPNTLTFSTGQIDDIGDIVCSARVSNDYGNEAYQEISGASSFSVYDYVNPQITSVLAFRCDANNVPADDGAYIAVKATVTYSRIGGNNDLKTFQGQYRKDAQSEWSDAVDLENGIVARIPIRNADQQAPAGGFQVLVTVIDLIQDKQNRYSSQINSVLTTEVTIHFLNGGSNVSVGFQGTEPFAFQISPQWKFMRGSMEIDLGDRVLDDEPIPGSQNTCKSGGIYDAIQALLPTPLSMTIAVSSWTYSENKYVYEYQADVDAKTCITANFVDDVGAQSLKAGILISPGAGKITFQTDLLPTNTVNLALYLQELYESASPFFLSNGKGGETPYEAISEFIVQSTVTNPTENINMIMLMPNGYVIAILDVLWQSYSNVKIAAIPDGFRPVNTLSMSVPYYNSASGNISPYNTTIRINAFGDVSMQSVSPSAFYGLSKLFAYYLQNDSQYTYGAFEIVENGYFAGATIVLNRITKIGGSVKYEIEASFDTPQTFPANTDIGIHAPAGFLPNSTPEFPTAYITVSGSSTETSRGMRMITSTYAYLWFDGYYAQNVEHFRMEFATNLKTT